MAKELKIGILQQHNVADRGDNMRRLADGVTSLAQRGAELIVLQELHNSLYFCQVESVDNFDLAEPVPGPSTDFYGQLAKQLNVVIVTSLFERRAPGLYHNTAVVMERDGTIAGIYRKMHIPDVLFYARRPRFSANTNLCGQTWCARLLGSMVSGSCPSDGIARCGVAYLPHSYRL